METSKHLFNELEKAEQLFSDGSIKNGQKILREAIKNSKDLKKIPNKLRHKINSVISKSRYFDDMSSFAANPKRDNLINEISKLVADPNEIRANMHIPLIICKGGGNYLIYQEKLHHARSG